EAEQQGVRRGMPLREARAFCREALFLDARPALYRERHECMLAALDALSPVVEGAEPGCAYVGLDGLAGPARASEAAQPEQGGCASSVAPPATLSFAPIFADEDAAAGALARAVAAALGLRPQIGIAQGRFAALAAALAASGETTTILEERDVAAFLAPLPVHLLPFDEPIMRRLYWLGLRRVGEIAALPRAALAAQFGPIGERAWDLA